MTPDPYIKHPELSNNCTHSYSPNHTASKMSPEIPPGKHSLSKTTYEALEPSTETCGPSGYVLEYSEWHTNIHTPSPIYSPSDYGEEHSSNQEKDLHHIRSVTYLTPPNRNNGSMGQILHRSMDYSRRANDRFQKQVGRISMVPKLTR